MSASLQRGIGRHNPVKVSRQCAQPAQRRLHSRSAIFQPRVHHPQIPHQRAFSISIPRRFADINEDLDPRTVERESDEVDVCIIGGGKYVVAGAGDQH